MIYEKIVYLYGIIANNMKNITFTSGTMQKFCDTFYELNLFDKDGKKVYSATLEMSDAASVMNKHNNIKMI